MKRLEIHHRQNLTDWLIAGVILLAAAALSAGIMHHNERGVCVRHHSFLSEASAATRP